MVSYHLDVELDIWRWTSHDLVVWDLEVHLSPVKCTPSLCSAAGGLVCPSPCTWY